MADEAGKPNSILAHDLKYLQGVLAPDEIIVEVEQAGLDAESGALVVTDRRVVFSRTTAFRKRTHLVSMPLLDVARAEGSERRSPFRKRGIVTLHASGTDGPRELTFEYIVGGKHRANEIVASIVRQRGLIVDAADEVPPESG